MKQLPHENVQLQVGQCCRLNINRQGSLASHLVLIIAAEGEWCRVLDLQVYGQPNPAAGERMRWTNPHFELEPIPVAQWPLAARHWWATAGFRTPASSGDGCGGRRGGRSAVVSERRTTLAAVAPARRCRIPQEGCVKKAGGYGNN